jgi:2-polyprenyl-3-methyl-5-hydroxy-6-metoxy-1,4-benzoquinol methylase
LSNRDITLESWQWVDANPSDCHRYVLPTLLRILKPLNPKRVLDVGCGNGSQTAALARAGFNITGCDVDKPGITIAQQAYPQCRFLNVGVYDDPSLMGELGFDVVLSIEVIEHLYKPRELMRFAKKAMSRNGKLILSTPHHGYFKNLAISLFNGWDRHFHPWVDGGHIKFFSPASLARLLEEEGFKVEKQLFVGRVPFLAKSMVLVCSQLQQ